MKNDHSCLWGATGLAVASLAAALISFSARADALSTVSRDLEPFTKIAVKGAIELDLVAGQPLQVQITAADDLSSTVRTIVRDGVLIIDTEEDSRKKSWLKDDDIHVTIEMPLLEGLSISGAVDGRLANIQADVFTVDIGGAADLKIAGNCGTLDLNLKGASDIDARDFKCMSAKVRMRGAGDADIFASESVDVEISGVGSIDVHGSPANVRKQMNGIGSITIKQ